MQIEVSIIIRVRNEVKALKKLLQILKNQTYQGFEIVIVDNDSEDGSDKIAYNYFPKNRITLVHIPKDEFTYPYASNIGATHAKGTYLVYVSAHSFPISSTWLSDGLMHLKDPKVAGVFAYPIADSTTNIFEKLYYNVPTTVLHFYKRTYTRSQPGLLGKTNAILRRDLWEKYHFNQKYIKGNEDVEWADYWMKKGYAVVQDPKFRVYHAHYLTLFGIIKQQSRWFYQHYKMLEENKKSRMESYNK